MINSSNRQLNVNDALVYLDDVKNQFREQPEIYNRFLEIMKEFKSQRIDTPGVIDRVSTLFSGNTNLILGFNTFLPPGYRIEPSSDSAQGIRVITPSTQLSLPGFEVSGAPTPGFPQASSHRAVAVPAVAPEIPAAPPVEEKRQPLEFNHAISYVNKIKNRYASDPDTYKQFLEILQTYQREQKPIQEVYAQVRVLFDGAPDLLDEFKQFLPDTSSPAANLTNQNVAPAKQPVYTPAKSAVPRLNRANRKLVSPVAPTKRFPAGSTVAPSAVQQQQKKRKVTVSSAQLARDKQISEELEFFEKVKKSMNNKIAYSEFLRILNLFSQGILDSASLIARVEPFLSRTPELFEWLKRFVKFEEAPIIYNVPAPIHAVDIRTCRRSGHSYRLLPPEVKQPPSSNRDAMCHEVLNDTWISHPVFASEDSGFLTHRKNQYEEALHKVEEERFEFDTNIEANLQTIATLEPIARRIQKMSNDERAQLKLPVGLGGWSKTIYQRVVRKVYGKERGLEMIEALHDCPAVAVPIVLKRLKQKDEEWKRAQREWNKVWRDVERKNFYKALDYQSANFKANDKKMLTPKMFIQEIENLQLEQEHRRLLSNKSLPSSPRYQFDFTFRDVDVFKDANNLLFFYAQYGGGLSTVDSGRVAEFLKGFLAKFFLLEDIYAEHATLEQTIQMLQSQDTAASTSDSDSDISSTSSSSSKSVGSSRQGKSRRFRNTLVEENGVGADGEVKPVVNGGTATSVMDVDSAAIKDDSVSGPAQSLVNRSRKTFVMYASNAIYAFFRMYQVLYSRLAKMKELAAEIARRPPSQMRNNSVAVSMGVQEKLAPENEGANEHAYEIMIKTICRFYKGRIDHSQFEEKVRFLFGGSAYLIFTIDKVALAVIKQISAVMSDLRCLELIQLYEKDRLSPSSSPRQEAMYRLAAETALPDENLYRFELFALERVMTMQLLSKYDLLAEDNITPEERWSLYIDHYLQLHTSEGIRLRRREPFLKRNLPPTVQDVSLLNVNAKSGLELKICVNTYKLFFIQGTEDFFQRLVKIDVDESLLLERRRAAKARKWLRGAQARLGKRRNQAEADLYLRELDEEGQRLNGESVVVADDSFYSRLGPLQLVTQEFTSDRGFKLTRHIMANP